MPSIVMYIILVIILAIAAYFGGGTRPALSVLGVGLLMVLFFFGGSLLH